VFTIQCDLTCARNHEIICEKSMETQGGKFLLVVDARIVLEPEEALHSAIPLNQIQQSATREALKAVRTLSQMASIGFSSVSREIRVLFCDDKKCTFLGSSDHFKDLEKSLIKQESKCYSVPVSRIASVSKNCLMRYH